MHNSVLYVNIDSRRGSSPAREHIPCGIRFVLSRDSRAGLDPLRNCLTRKSMFPYGNISPAGIWHALQDSPVGDFIL